VSADAAIEGLIHIACESLAARLCAANSKHTDCSIATAAQVVSHDMGLRQRLLVLKHSSQVDHICQWSTCNRVPVLVVHAVKSTIGSVVGRMPVHCESKKRKRKTKIRVGVVMAVIAQSTPL
jgi:glutamyl-tRNA reductase